jgi:excisionase family DNA binding protein
MATKNSDPNSEVLDKEEAAILLRISSRTLDTWMRKRRVPFSKLPSGTIRFRRGKLLEFLEKYSVI